MERKEITCIGCPMGCLLLVEIDDKGQLLVTGNNCNIGKSYGEKEMTNPTRVITTTIEVKGGHISQLSVKSEKDIPKDMIFSCLKALKGQVVEAPIKIGDIIYINIEGTGVNIIATKNIRKVV